MVRRLRTFVLLGLAMVLGALPASGQVAEVLRVERLPASLAGTWEFALGDPPGGVAELDGLPFRPVPVPGSWQNGGIPGHGTGWYRVTFDLDPSLAIVPLAFACMQIRDADEVFLDGLPIGRTGEFPPDYDKGTVVERIYELPPSRTAIPGRHSLAVRVFNAGPRGGGITGVPRIDSVSTAFHARAFREAPRAFLAAAFAALGLFSLFFFLRDRGQADFLYFFLTTTGTAIFIVSWLSFWAVSGLPLTFLFRVGHAGMFAVPAMTLLLFLKFFERPLARGHIALLAAQGAGTVACLLWPRADDLYYLLPAAIALGAIAAADVVFHLAVAARRRAPHSRLVLGATLLAIAAATFDGAGVLGLGIGTSIDFALSGPACFVLMSCFLASMADRLARLRLPASTDPLTGLANRAVLFDRLSLEIARAKRHGHPVALGIVDLDSFKPFNDRYGHVAGDRLLVAVGRALLDSIRDTDLAARFGGDEFVVLLPEADATQAVACLERIRLRIARARVAGAEEGDTASAGIAVFDPTVRASVSVSAWLRQADAALYAAKAAGRNRVLVAHGAPPAASSVGGSEVRVVPVRRVPGASD
ncbi:MAG TPA: diguanylate cyclase [Thermoanaerobaculia bacterium]|nr:diguanylate cyclase [Thermoanaerobaculia bacterium]